MDNFNIKRFGHTFRWYFCENRGRLLAWTAGLTLGIFVVQSLFLGMTIAHIEGLQLTSEIIAGVCVPMSGICALFTLWFVFSQIFSTLKTKQKRIAYLTLPATNLERYLAAFLMAVVVWPICVMLAVALGDTLRMVFFGLLGKGWVSGVVTYFSSEGNHLTGWEKVLNYVSDFSLSAWVCSAFILGGTWFRKRQFLFTGIIMIVLTTAFVWLCAKLHINYEIWAFDSVTKEVHMTWLVYPSIIGFLVLSLLNFWGSYQIFKRFQIITSKWVNI